MKPIFLCVLASLCLTSTLHAAAEQANPVKIEFEHKHWQVLSTKEDGAKLCYLYSAPTASTGTFKKRANPYIFVTTVGENDFEFSTSSGYTYKENSDVEVWVEQNRFPTVVKDTIAWMKTKSDDQNILKALAKYNSLVVKGTSKMNTKSEDKYSLSGFTASFEWMKKHCQKAKSR